MARTRRRSLGEPSFDETTLAALIADGDAHVLDGYVSFATVKEHLKRCTPAVLAELKHRDAFIAHQVRSNLAYLRGLGGPQ